MEDSEVDRVTSFVKGMWALTTTSLATYTGRHGMSKKDREGAKRSSLDAALEASDGLPAVSQRAIGAAFEEVVRRRLHALAEMFSVNDGWRYYASQKGAQRMDVTEAPITTCHAC